MNGDADVAAAASLIDRDGQFAAWQEPQLFSEEVPAGFRGIR